ncbi:tripartite tricarboxylate transporter substrate binding protein [Variovorax sp. J31P179]|uniref:Bug family tripartite tricarboxylate transporter substrate binding protein n=1 Tax=Variovorax sp. J31P179 TaxID=3053508 RepID=UPI002578141B|nr:tripartite tricarboxylate transporter substrate binding protein [Variovorax sp. J31P179]
MRRTLALGLSTAFLSFGALAQSYPTKPIRWVVGFPAGGGTDVLARTVAAPMSTSLGQQVLVDNKAGAAGMIAAEAVARSEPDGYTLLTADIAILALNPAIYPKVRYNPLVDFVNVGLMARFPLLIATHPSSGIKSIQQLVADGKKGANVNYGSAGVGTPHHMAMEVLLSTTGIKATHVPYKGDAPALQDVAGGQIPLAVVAPSLSLPFVKEGRLVPLAVTSEKRMPQLPDVPTLKELGYAPAAVYAWQGMVVPKGTPAPVVATLSSQMRAAIEQPAVRQKLADLGMEAIGSDSAEMDRYVREQIAFWARLIPQRGIKAD